MNLFAQAVVITLSIVNARVWTGDARRPWADAIAVTGNRIEFVGSSAEVRKRTPATARLVDAHGGMVVPGFTDAHVHFIEGGFALASVQLRDAKTKEEFIRRIAAFAKTVPHGAWITNGDWDHENWGGELPAHQWIDSVTPDNPVWINRLDGHMNLANAAALKAAGVTRSVADVSGGTIVRDASGEPTGVFKDNAQVIVERAMPAPPPATLDRALDAAMHYVAAQGVTSVHNMGSWTDLAVFERAHHSHTLITRIYAAVPLSSWRRLADTVKARGFGDDWLRIGAVKGFVDGSIGSHTAAMLQPFTDSPKDSGFFVNTAEHLYEWTSNADKNGLHVIVHAIGDRAIRTQLDIFERVEKENGPRDRRFRIEHAQHIAPADMARFAQLGVIASMQPYHAIDDGRWVEKVIGPERAKGTYAFRSLLDAKTTLAFGSDWYVAPPVPLTGIYAAVTRRTLDEKRPLGWMPEQKISIEEALRAYTAGGSFAGFAEKDRGKLQAGMLADIAVIDRDLTKIAPETIRDAKVVMTIVDGKVVFEREPAPSYEVYAIRYASLKDFRVSSLIAGADTSRRLDIAMMVWLMKGPDGRIMLMDAGFKRDDLIQRWKPADFVTPAAALERFGVRREAVTDLIISHVHWDHLDGADLFPNAKIWIQKDEYEHHVDSAGKRLANAIDTADATMLYNLKRAGRVNLVDGDAREIIPGITVYVGGKHTFQSQYAGVSTASGVVVLASDNVYLYENLERHIPISQTLDAASNLAAQDRMTRIASSTRLIVPGHDPAVFERFPLPGNGVARIK